MLKFMKIFFIVMFLIVALDIYIDYKSKSKYMLATVLEVNPSLNVVSEIQKNNLNTSKEKKEEKSALNAMFDNIDNNSELINVCDEYSELLVLDKLGRRSVVVNNLNDFKLIVSSFDGKNSVYTKMELNTLNEKGDAIKVDLDTSCELINDRAYMYKINLDKFKDKLKIQSVSSIEDDCSFIEIKSAYSQWELKCGLNNRITKIYLVRDY